MRRLIVLVAPAVLLFVLADGVVAQQGGTPGTPPGLAKNHDRSNFPPIPWPWELLPPRPPQASGPGARSLVDAGVQVAGTPTPGVAATAASPVRAVSGLTAEAQLAIGDRLLAVLESADPAASSALLDGLLSMDPGPEGKDAAAELVERLSGLMDRPAEVSAAFGAFNRLVSSAHWSYLVDPPAEFLMIHATLAGATATR